MRISFFVPRCTPENSHGRYVIELARRLGLQWPVTVYSGAFWPPLRSLVHCKFLPVPNRPTVARLGALWTASIVAARARGADIVHTQGADAPVGNVVTAQFCNAVMQNSAGEDESLYRRFNYAIGSVAEKYCMSKSSTLRIVAISQQVKADLEREYGVDAGKIVVIPHGVDLEGFHPTARARWRGAVRDSLGIGPQEFVILFVGGDYRRKGLVALLQAAQLVPRAKVLAVGVKPDAELERFVSVNALGRVVKFVSTTAEIAPLYAATDCFVLPTLYDTFSMATLEAMASGLSVIVSRRAGVTELVTTNLDCLVLEDPRDVETLARHLETLQRDDALRTRLELEARKTAERYSWDKITERTLQVYGDTMANA